MGAHARPSSYLDWNATTPPHPDVVAAMANGRIPFDAKVAAENADVATFMSKLPFAGFVEGSAP